MTWTSVKDRLPEKDRIILAYLPYIYKKVDLTLEKEYNIICILYLNYCGRWNSKDNSLSYDSDSVSHWMLLPDPPKSQEHLKKQPTPRTEAGQKV